MKVIPLAYEFVLFAIELGALTQKSFCKNIGSYGRHENKYYKALFRYQTVR